MKIDQALIDQIAKEDPQYAAQIAKDYRRAMITLARRDPSMFCAYVLRNERTGGAIHQHPDHERVHRTILENPRAAIWTHPEFGKDLPLTTEIPTPHGWKLMGDLKVGDQVFDARGVPTEVIWAGPVQHNDLYELELDDGVTVQAGQGHLWLAHHTYDRSLNPERLRMVDTQTIARTLISAGRKTWSLPITEPVSYPELDLPIAPYVLGAWLGDGDSSGPQLTCHQDDRFIYDRCQALVGEPGREACDKQKPHVLRCRIGGPIFSKALRALGVTGMAGCKFIPEAYLLGSIEQRLELLKGLLDTDGTVYTRKCQTSYIEVSFCVERLATDTLELVRSLGFKARIRSEPSKLYGQEVGIRHRIFFTARTPVFHLPRKLAKQVMAMPKGSKATTRTIVRATKIPTVPTRCIKVLARDGTFLCGRAYTVTHNCEVAGSPVLLENGAWAPIESLTGWARVLTWDGVSPTLKTVTARSKPNGLSETVRITLSDGRVLQTTPNHPLMSADSVWKRADSIQPGEHLVCLRTLELPEITLTPESDIPDDEAEILGYLLAGRSLRTGSVQLRTLGSNQKWSKRREKLLGSAGWKKIPVARVDGSTVTFGQQRGVMPPATFLRLWATVDAEGWPVDVHPAVYKLRRRAIERLLSAFFSAAFMELPNKRRRSLAGTVGLGEDRAPHMVGHVRKETLLCIQRLLLRVGASARISRLRDVDQVWLSMVAFKQVVGKKLSSERPWKITLDHGEFRRFWPSQMAPPVDSLVGTARVETVEVLPDPVETWAVEVIEEEHSYFSQGVLSHNTNQISIGHVLWRIGTDPNCSIAIMTNTGGLASRVIGSLKTYISESLEFRDVFPNVRPGEKWSETAFTVTRETIRKDPTVQAVGLTGSIVGSRLDGLIIDDIDDIDSTHTQEARNATEAKVRKQALTRLGIDGWAVAIGNVWHEDDCMHRLAKTNWKVLEFPVMNPDGEGGFVSRDPETFPIERIHLIRDEDVGPVEFQRLYMLQARIDGEQRFRPEWIDAALLKGKGLTLCTEGLPSIPRGCRAITGVDLGVKQKASSDPTAIVTILEMPQDGQRVEYQILNIVKGRWNAEEIMNNVTAQQRLFGSEVWVESNGAQDFLIQLLNMNGSGIPVRAFWTGKNKFDPAFGVESIASEMALGRWWIPSFEGTRDSTEMEVEQLVQEMLAYTPGNHTGDILMALWIARESARTSRATSKGAVEFGRLRLRR